MILTVVGVVSLVIAAVVSFGVARRLRRARDRATHIVDDHRAQTVAARNEASRWAAALEASGDGVIVVDADGEVLLRNQFARRFDGARHSEAVAEELISRLLDLARTGEDVREELALFGPPREVLLVHALPLREGDRVAGAVAFVRDVSELRRVESVRRDFVANVSHELKTPIGALAVLSETVVSSDDPTVIVQLSGQMLREADRLARIVDDLLDLSLIEAQESPTRERVAVRVVFDEAIERVRAVALAQGIPLRVEPVPPDLLVACDPTQVVSAVTNLLDNAIKYSESGSPVSLAARREPAEGTEGGRVVIEVSDRGIGIPSRDLERIFERFYRVDRARSRATGGTGLGLSIVRHVAQVHGGDVTVSSLEGEGSTFSLALPIAEGAVNGIAEAS